MSQGRQTATCPSCGATASGKFCNQCGASLDTGICTACQASLSPGARFCHACGAPTRDSAGSKKRLLAVPWLVAAAAVVILGLVIVVRPASAPPQAASPGPAIGGSPGAAPDISSLTPRQQADRLFDLIMTAAEAGDTGRVAFHTDMALQAYSMLGEPDSDARYHIGLIHLVRGERAEALAQADSLQASLPGHLLAILLRHSVAEAAGDSDAVAQSYREFLTHYDTEIALARPEYQMHQSSIDSFLDQARAATGG